MQEAWRTNKISFHYFFNTTFYARNCRNTKDQIDFSIYLEKHEKSDIGVGLELKKPSNKEGILINIIE